MFAMNLVDVVAVGTNYGILLCYNEKITKNNIQRKIYEIKEQLESKGVEWMVEDIISNLPTEWNVHLQNETKRIFI